MEYLIKTHFILWIHSVFRFYKIAFYVEFVEVECNVLRVT
jgi:hypothetical protein